MFIYFWERERKTEHEQGRGRERRRHRIWSRLQALSCQPRARCRARTHKLWDPELSWGQTLNWLSQIGVPIFFFNLYFWERERKTEHEQGRSTERERDRMWSRLRFWAVSTEPDAGLKLTDCEIMTWAKVRHSTDWATQVLQDMAYFDEYSICT